MNNDLNFEHTQKHRLLIHQLTTNLLVVDSLNAKIQSRERLSSEEYELLNSATTDLKRILSDLKINYEQLEKLIKA